ncbi:MAG: PEGA domain-containing protein [Polyangiales bacterium]
MQGLLGVGGFVRLVFVLGLLTVSSGALAQEESPGVIVITASDDASSGAAIRIDGEPSGSVPLRKTLTPGRHLVQIGKRGFTTFSKWVDLVSGQVMTIPVALQPAVAKTGSLLITADVTGLPVYIDGQRRGGTPLVVDGLTEGEHVVEIKSPGEGYQPFFEVVTVKPDQRTTVEATIRLAPDLGSLRVIANVPGSIIRLDGVDIGVAPAAKGGLSPGEHIVTAEASGYESVTQTVTVIAGRERVVSLRFTTESTEIPRILVRASVPDATVTIDGEEYGSPPITIEPADLGTHSVVVRAPGYREVRRTCSVGPSRNCEVYAELNALGVHVRVEANVSNAQLYVDGELRGPVPWEGDLPAGIHQLEVRAEGHGNHVEQIRLQKSPSIRLIQVILTPAVVPVESAKRDKAAEREDPLRNTVTHAGAPNPPGVATLDFSTGWPWLAWVGLRAGLTEFLDVGISVQTFGRLTDFTLSTKAGWRVSPHFSVGGDLQIGGGIGPARRALNGDRHPTNNFFISLDAIFSFHFPPRGAFSVWIAGDFNSDRWDFDGRNSNIAVRNSRENFGRARLGGSLEIVVTQRWNVWIEVEGIVAGKRRPVLGDIFGGGHPDSLVYGQFGATFKFGSAKEGS